MGRSAAAAAVAASAAAAAGVAAAGIDALLPPSLLPPLLVPPLLVLLLLRRHGCIEWALARVRDSALWHAQRVHVDQPSNPPAPLQTSAAARTSPGSKTCSSRSTAARST